MHNNGAIQEDAGLDFEFEDTGERTNDLLENMFNASGMRRGMRQLDKQLVRSGQDDGL